MPDNQGVKLTHEQIRAICRRGLGSAIAIESLRELGGGTLNEAYLVELAGGTRVILRAAPPPTADTYWDDVALMRRELQILPFFASIAALMPRVLMADFTHQLVERDYVLQTYVAGERWSDIEEQLTPAENAILWRQCGEIVRRIHDTAGDAFGHPYPLRQFTSWSEALFDRLARIGESMAARQLEVSAFSTILAVARANASRFDEIRTPRLLHGDLWTYNLLVTRGSDGPWISGVLDADRAWWGDPPADWIMFLWAVRRDEPEWQERLSAFDDGYGAPERDEGTRFRQEVYRAMHIGACAVGAATSGDGDTVARARRELREIARAAPQWA